MSVKVIQTYFEHIPEVLYDYDGIQQKIKFA